MTRPLAVEPLVAARRSRPASRRPVTSRMSCSRLLASSSGAKVRKVSGLSAGDLAQPAAEHPGGLVRRGAGPVDRVRRSRASRAAAGRAAAGRRWRPGWRSSAAPPSGSARSSSAHRRAGLVEQLLRPVRPQPRLEHLPVLGVLRGRRAAAPGGRGTCPRPVGRRRPAGTVQPFGVRSTIIGQRGAWLSVARALGRAACWIAAISSRQRSSAAAMAWCTRGRIVADRRWCGS